MKFKKYSIPFYICITLIFVIFFSRIVNFVYPQAFFDIAYSNFIFQKKMLKKLKKKNMTPDMLIIGDMSTPSITMSTLMPSTVTLGLERATPVEMYYVLQDYLKDFKAPKCIVLNYSYFKDNYPDIFSLYVTNGLYDFNRYNEISENYQRLNMEDFPITNYEFISSYLNYDSYSLNRMQKIFNRDELEKSKFRSYRMEEDILSYNGNYFVTANDKRLDKIYSVLNSRFTSVSLFDFYLEEILKFGLKNNIKVYFLETPLSSSLEQNRFIKRRKYHLGNLVLKVHGSYYVPTNEFYNDDKLVNPVVLSRKGAVVFTNKILKKLDCK